MGNPGDAHRLMVIIDNVHDTVIADADTPEILVTAQFLVAERSWINDQTINPRYQVCKELIAQALQLLPCGRLDIQSVSSHAGDRA
ncbi:protein of unknown function [Candidatus Methylomirabilis oxygeniifera]|uniref:Uncharacterized protein n=1 Tax=Methylomirabilis oxygeniifera TaxID=671143 RepID=D5MKN1_METO1|nr:protein of unknown function [Candidatus Methylomirabilis oxyfera]